ncbi:MAG: hypothetical protein ACFFD4_22835 [Candidatus Odinarchaeota archaeon]
MKEEDAWNSVQLMQTSVDLAVYRQTLAYALGNLIIMAIISSGLLVVVAFVDTFWIFLISWVIISIVAIGVHVYVFREVFRRVRLGSPVVAYPVVITAGYIINSFLGNPISVNFLWYPLLGVSSLIVGLTAEQRHFSANKLFARPVLLLGLVLLLSSPVVFLIVYLIPDAPELFIIPGFALLLTSLSTSYSMAQAEKKVVNK